MGYLCGPKLKSGERAVQDAARNALSGTSEIRQQLKGWGSE